MTISLRFCWTSGSLVTLPVLAGPKEHTDEEMVARSCDSDAGRPVAAGCRGHPVLLLLLREALVSLAK